MRMHVLNFLLPDAPRVDYDPETVRATVLDSQLVGNRKDSTQCRRIGFICRRQRSNVAFGDHQKVKRTQRIDVVKGIYQIVFIDLARRNFTMRDLAEQAIVHDAPTSPSAISSRRSRKFLRDGAFPGKHLRYPYRRRPATP